MKECSSRSLTRRALLIVVLIAVAPAMVRAQLTPNPPGQISYQGFLTDANGVPLAGSAPKNYDVNFRIYTAPTGGTAVWGEVQTVTVDRGYFSVLLGQGAALSGGERWTNNLVGIFTGPDSSDRYIGITVKGITTTDSEIQPRLRLLASPYSFLSAKANNATTLAGYDWTALFPDTGNPGTGTFPASKLTPNSITAAQIANGAIGSSQIATGAVGAVQIANGGVGTAQIANGAVTSAQIANGTIGGAQVGLPLSLATSVCDLFRIGGNNTGVLNVNNTATACTFPFFVGPAILATGVTAIEARSQNGNNAASLGDNTYAGYFSGNVTVNGTLSKTAGSFLIDHPLDPAHKYLYHSFVESPDMKNIYDGIAVLDGEGRATVALPDYFEALNMEYRYQLTAIGAPGPNLHVAQEISNNRFQIAGGVAGMKVSWQVTGIRHDAYANAHRIQVEVEKPAELQGHFLNPVELGFSKASNERFVRHLSPPAAEPVNSPEQQ